MKILASEVLQRENKKDSVTKCYPSEYWTPRPLIPSPSLVHLEKLYWQNRIIQMFIVLVMKMKL